MNWQKVTLTVLGLIGLYLILANGNAFNEALKTTTSAGIKGVVALQGRDPKGVA